mmetsp:Transcript_37016/g.115201  ORF Transcript_37016/g.115201 Transcript_37016/m.115201 type:complete len:257 (-) Transcript_37016:260-1030(-)
MTFSTSRKFRPTARMRSCTKPGTTGRRSFCGTGRRFVRAPRAAMFSLIGPLNFRLLRASRASLRVPERSATSSSPAVAKDGRASVRAVPMLPAAAGSRSRVPTCSAPGYSMRTARAKPQSPECATEPARRTSSSSEASGWAPQVTNHNGGALAGFFAAVCTTRSAASRTSTSPASDSPSARTTAAQRFSCRRASTEALSARSSFWPAPWATQRQRLSPPRSSRWRDAACPRTSHCSGVGSATGGAAGGSRPRHSTP